MSSLAVAIVSLLSVAAIAALVLRLLRPRKQNGFHRDDTTAVFHAGAGHAMAHGSGFSPSCDASGSCGVDGGGGAAL